MSEPPSLLVVEDDPASRVTLAAVLEAEGYRVEARDNSGESLNFLIHHPVDIVISDLRLPDGSGLQILWALKNLNPMAEFILVTGYASLETAIEAANQGVFAYHVKPLDLDALKCSVRNALKQQRLNSDKRDLLDKVQQANGELKLSVAELELKNRELVDALAKVKLLSGLLPICAFCKKIRSDAGYWSEIENYIGQHSDAEFTHGICPDCIKHVYPDLEQQLTHDHNGSYVADTESSSSIDGGEESG